MRARRPTPRAARWSLYLVRTSAGALYTGISNDVDRRFEQHATGRGAKALRGKGPLELVYRVAIGDRAAAQRVEHALKRLSKAEKEAVVATQPKRRRWMSVMRPRPARTQNAGRARLHIALGIALIAACVLCARWLDPAASAPSMGAAIEADGVRHTSEITLATPNAPSRVQDAGATLPDSPSGGPRDGGAPVERVVDVEVVDADGVAAPGIPVSLRALESGDRIASERTDSRGRASLNFESEGLSARERLRIGPTWITSTPPGIEFSLDSIPTGILRLALAPSGSVELALVGSEGFALDPNGYYAMYADDGRCAAERVHALHEIVADLPLEARSIVIPHVGLNLCFSARAWTRDLVHDQVSFDGPTSPGERVRVELRFAGARVRVTGRALDSSGAPLPDLSVAAYKPGEHRRILDALTGADGAFVAYAEPEAVRMLPSQLAVEAKRPGAPDRHGLLVWPGIPSPLPAGVITTVDVGSIRLDSELSLVSGRVVDARGRPHSARILVRSIDPGSSRHWSPLQDSNGKDGSFELSSSRPLERFELRADAWDTSPSEIVRAERGARDVVLVLRVPCRIELKFQLQSEIDVNDLDVWFRCADPPTCTDHPVGSYDTHDDGRIVTRPLAPGVYKVSVQLGDIELATREIDLRTDCSAGIVAPIDLRELVHPIHVTVATSVATRLEEGYVEARSGEWSSGERLTREGTSVIAAPTTVVDIVASAPNCLTRRFEGVVDGARLELLPGIPVDLRVPDFPGMPAGETLEVEIAPAESNPMSDVVRRTRFPIDERGAANLTLPCDGRFTVRALIRERGRRDDIAIPVIRPTEIQIQAGAQPNECTIELDIGALRAALDKLRDG